MDHFDPKSEMQTFCEQCKSLGLAVTVQRRAVFQALMESMEHPSADTIYEKVVRHFPNVSRTSVYRILDTFSRHGLVRKVDHPDAATRYDAFIRPHHHAVCISCGMIIDVPFSPEDKAFLQRVHQNMEGFAVNDFSVTFQGVCRKCQTSADH